MKDPGDLAKGPGPRSLRQHATGSVRDTRRGRGRYDLLPAEAIHLVAKHFEEGAEKYGDSNWKRGQPLSWYLDSGLRHVFAGIMAGDDSERHDVAWAWNALAFIWTREMIRQGKLPAELDDLGGEQC